MKKVLAIACVLVMGAMSFGADKKPDLLVFSASWCAPCQVLKAKLDNTDLSSVNVIRYDYDTDKSALGVYGVRSIPTLILVQEDKEIRRNVGSGVDLKEFISVAGSKGIAPAASQACETVTTVDGRILTLAYVRDDGVKVYKDSGSAACSCSIKGECGVGSCPTGCNGGANCQATRTVAVRSYSSVTQTSSSCSSCSSCSTTTTRTRVRFSLFGNGCRGSSQPAWTTVGVVGGCSTCK